VVASFIRRLRRCDEAGMRSVQECEATIRSAHRVRSEGRRESDYEMKQESVNFIFVVLVLLLVSSSCLRRRATCMRHGPERWGSVILAQAEAIAKAVPGVLSENHIRA
jgi:hypothetical protein